jgi:hypothetical protein
MATPHRQNPGPSLMLRRREILSVGAVHCQIKVVSCRRRYAPTGIGTFQRLKDRFQFLPIIFPYLRGWLSMNRHEQRWTINLNAARAKLPAGRMRPLAGAGAKRASLRVLFAYAAPLRTQITPTSRAWPHLAASTERSREAAKASRNTDFQVLLVGLLEYTLS